MTKVVQKREVSRTLLDELPIEWRITERETLVFCMMWRRGDNIQAMAKKLRRTPLEICLLVIEQTELEVIKPRHNGLL